MAVSEPLNASPHDPISFRGLDVCPNLTISVNFHWFVAFPQADQLVLNARLTRLDLECYRNATAFRAFVASLSGCTLLDFRVPVSYSRTIIVFVGIRYKHLRVHDERSESLYTLELYVMPRPVSGLRPPLASALCSIRPCP